MNHSIIVILLFLLIGCQSQNSKPIEAEKKVETTIIEVIEEVEKKMSNIPDHISTKPNSISYDSTLALIESKRLELRSHVQNGQITVDSVGHFFCNALVNNIIPYWYGTPWDFNGHTDVPNESNVACGYFVSTPLRHMEIKVNRFKLAQQASMHIVKSLACESQVYSYHKPNVIEMVDEIKSTYSDGIYTVGLSNHVGYLLLKKGELYFIHSNYGYPQEVVIEIASESDVFSYSDVFYISSISNNVELMKKWLNANTVTILTS